MLKKILTGTLALITFVTAVQAQIKANRQIRGEVTGKPVLADTILFIKGPLNQKYYKQHLTPAPLNAGHYTVKNNLSYPVLFKIAFASEKNKRIWRNGDYFIDSSTDLIKTDNKNENCNEVSGTTAKEYRSKFIPFIVKGTAYDCKSSYVSDLFYDSGKKADSLILDYVRTYPSSYVALWKLIERFSSYGQSSVRQQALAGFSDKIKQGELWTMLSKDFKKAKIKEDAMFPDVALKTLDLEPTKLILPKAKFILIDFWFARCRPCLDTIPALKKLYHDYKEKGFEIVSISVDETLNVPIWQKRVKEHGLVWPQYLEENNFRSNELGVKAFPTFVLLNDRGVVINKDFDLHELDRYLNKHL